tara:strand:+ start:868 stop:1038 length:171 start_codon:yes stop_codon:yes gene_type:complete
MSKLHQDKAYLESQIAKKLNSREIAKDLGVSYRLVEIYLEEFNIPFVSTKPVIKEN